MKHRLLFLALAAAILLTACSKGQQSSSTLSELSLKDDGGFLFAEGFYIPPTPEGCTYTYTFNDMKKEQLTELVDTVFGDGEYSRGEYDGTNEYELTPIYAWHREEYLHSASLDGSGSVCVINEENDPDYFESIINGDTQGREIVFEYDFDKTVLTLNESDYTVSELALSAQKSIRDIENILGYETELVPLYAVPYCDITEPDKTLYAEIIFCARTDTGRLRSVIGNNMLKDKTGMNIPAPNTYGRVRVYAPEQVSEVSIFFPAADIQRGDAVKILSCEEALSLAGDSIGPSSSHITLRLAQLEYSPTAISIGRYTAEPLWAFYYSDDEGENGVIYVDAQTGEISKGGIYI